MAQPLKVGLAGLGTVGGAVLQQLERGRDKLIARCGCSIEATAPITQFGSGIQILGCCGASKCYGSVSSTRI